jgi:hypothetical protein
MLCLITRYNISPIIDTNTYTKYDKFINENHPRTFLRKPGETVSKWLVEVSSTALHIDLDAFSLNCLSKLDDFVPYVTNSMFYFATLTVAQTT